MDWRDAFARHWPYKLAALFLAVLLWLNVTAEATEEFPLSTEVQVEVSDSAWVVVSVEPQQVNSVFQGQRPTFMPAERPVIREVIDTVTAPRMRLELSPRAIRGYAPELELTPVRVEPSRVEVRLERRTSRRVPVRPDLELSAAEGFTVVRPVLLEPDSLTVSGPESRVEALDALRTQRVELEDLRRTVSRDLRVRRPVDAPRLSWDPDRVRATVEVDSVVVRDVRRPLEIRGPGAGGVTADPDSVRLRVRGAARTVRSLDPATLSAYVRLDSIPAGEVSVPVKVESPGELGLTVGSRPVRATLRPSGRGGG